jgi:MFS family permease
VPLRLHRWRDPTLVVLAVVALAVGFGQFGAVASLGDVARAFGRTGHGATITDQVGLSGTQLGVGLAVLRFASLASLPLCGLADRVGRRTALLVATVVGLALTVLAAGAPGYWWFVAVFALGRPFLSASAAVAQVTAAEQTGSADRAKAVALIAGAYGVGSGLTAVLHALARAALGFRGVFALAVIPMAVVAFLQHRVADPDRFRALAGSERQRLPVLGAVAGPYRTRLLLLAVLAFALSVVTGPATSFFFLYTQLVRRLPGVVVAATVVAAGFAGLAGLLAGRWLADRYGRRPCVALGMSALVGFGILTYSGSAVAAVLGYVLGVFAGSVFAPGAGALLNELFPTPVRASAAGWQVAAGVLGAVAGLVAFGTAAAGGGRWAGAAWATFPPVLAAAQLVWLLPETRGREPEELTVPVPA